jgi:hypothetical protein
MVAIWRISEEKYPQKNQGTAGLLWALIHTSKCTDAAPYIYVCMDTTTPNGIWTGTPRFDCNYEKGKKFHIRVQNNIPRYEIFYPR